jgi:predicted DNA-binding protein with PD1-like motif
MTSYRFDPGPVHLVRLPNGTDLLDGVTEFAVDNKISSAWVGYLGAVSSASLRYFDQDAREYRDFVMEEPLELVSGVGNISRLDGAPFVHTHAVFADAEGRAFGGHVNRGCRIVVLELKVQELFGETPERVPDDVTGLSLWPALGGP